MFSGPSPQSGIYTHQSYSNPNSKFWLFDWLNYMGKSVISWYGQMVKKIILAWETEVKKGVCLRRLAKFSVHSKHFQSSYCAKVVAKTNLKWSGKGEGRRGNACPQTSWSFPSLPSSSLSLITIFCSCSNFLDELTRKRLLRRLKFRTRKFRPGITFTISTNNLFFTKGRLWRPETGMLNLHLHKPPGWKSWRG